MKTKRDVAERIKKHAESLLELANQALHRDADPDVVIDDDWLDSADWDAEQIAESIQVGGRL